MKPGFKRDHIRVNPFDMMLCKEFVEMFQDKTPVQRIVKIVEDVTREVALDVDETFSITVNGIEAVLDSLPTGQEEIVKNYIDQLESEELKSRLTALYWPKN